MVSSINFTSSFFYENVWISSEARGKKKTTTNELTTSFLLSKSCEYVAQLITVDMRVCCLVTLLRPSIIVELTIAQDVPAKCEDVSDYEGEPAQLSRQPLTLSPSECRSALLRFQSRHLPKIQPRSKMTIQDSSFWVSTFSVPPGLIRQSSAPSSFDRPSLRARNKNRSLSL